METLGVLWTTWIVGDCAVLAKNQNNLNIVDIGSHVGLTARYFNYRHPHSDITCYEPNPNTFLILKQNISKYKNIKAFNAAVHDFNGSSKLRLGDDAWGDSLLFKSSAPTIKVDVISASSVCSKHIDLLKIDGEGSEYAIMLDLDKTNIIKNVDNIVMEYHGLINNKKRLKKILDIFRKHHFTFSIGYIFRILAVSETEVLNNNSKKYDYLIISAHKDNSV